ncbi:MAG: hypothetical protein RLZZ427_1364 [Pseudomonadota bacterium]|jgi:histidine phosphotransferase ChpT
MTDTSLDLASLLCSRLCHDLLSPVGALANGLELLADEQNPEMRQHCFELLEQSARISADKLRFFRLAFGAAGGFGEQIPVEEARELVEALAANNGRIAISWSLGAGVLPKAAIKVLLNLALIAIEALVRGGTLEIGVEQRNSDIGGPVSEIAVRATGAKIAFDAQIGDALDGTLAEWDISSRTAPAWMIGQLAAGQGGGVQYALSDAALVLGAILPGG